MSSSSAGATKPTGTSRLSARREAEILAAVVELVREIGYEALTMDAVAARARSSKATLYRRWDGKPRLVAEAIRQHKPFRLDNVDTGSLRGDLHELAARIGGHTKDIELVRAIGPAVRSDEELAAALRQAILTPEIRSLTTVVDRAVDRGEVDEDSPARAFVPHLFFGAVFSRPLVEGGEPDAAYLTRYMDSVVIPALART